MGESRGTVRRPSHNRRQEDRTGTEYRLHLQPGRLHPNSVQPANRRLTVHYPAHQRMPRWSRVRNPGCVHTSLSCPNWRQKTRDSLYWRTQATLRMLRG